jgi:hypothetical protein
LDFEIGLQASSNSWPPAFLPETGQTVYARLTPILHNIAAFGGRYRMGAKGNGRKGMQDLKELGERFNLHNRAENKSSKTIEWYEDSIGHFCRFVEEWKRKPATLDDLNIEQVELFIVDLRNRPVRVHNAPTWDM